MSKLKSFGLLFFAVLIAGTFQVLAQSQCNCSTTGVCSATQSCPAGYLAVCTCTSASCGSNCQKADGPPPVDPPDNITFTERALIEVSAKEIGAILSNTFGRNIEFTPNSSRFRYTRSKTKRATGSHWDLFELLAKNGKLTIDGIGMDYWIATRDALLRGDDFTLCTGGAPVSLVSRHLAFISGSRLSIVDGDPSVKLHGAVKGNGLADILSKIGSTTSVSIVVN